MENKYFKKKTLKEAKELMKKQNPVFIARNHLVDEAIEKAINGNIEPYNKLLEILSKPYQYEMDLTSFLGLLHKNLKNVFKHIVEHK